MWILRCSVLLLASACALSSTQRCLVGEQEKVAFVEALLHEIQGLPDGSSQELVTKINKVLDSTDWRQVYIRKPPLQTGTEDSEIPGVRFRVLDDNGQQVIPEEFIPLSTDTIVHFVLEYRKIVAHKYGDLVRFSNNAQKGCFGVARVGESRGVGLWKIVVQSGSGKVIADGACLPKDMRLWDKYTVTIVRAT